MSDPEPKPPSGVYGVDVRRWPILLIELDCVDGGTSRRGQWQGAKRRSSRIWWWLWIEGCPTSVQCQGPLVRVVAGELAVHGDELAADPFGEPDRVAELLPQRRTGDGDVAGEGRVAGLQPGGDPGA